MYEMEFKQIIDASRNNSLTFFVGAGVSALSNAPSWKALIDDICHKIGYTPQDSYSSDEYLRIPQIFYYSIGQDNDTYYDFIKKRLSSFPLIPNTVHKELLGLIPVHSLQRISMSFWKMPPYNTVRVSSRLLVTAKCPA